MEWTLEKRLIKDLKPCGKNPRKLSKHDQEHLTKSLDKFGQCEPVVINSDGTIIGGHMRVRTMKKMGSKEVDVYVPQSPLSEKETDELNIRLNKNTGEFDFDILANEWEVEDLIEWGFLEDELGIGSDLGGDDDSKGSEEKKVVIVECPECAAHFEREQAKVVDKGD